MTDERWPRVKALFQAAVERPTEERAAFLAAATSFASSMDRQPTPSPRLFAPCRRA